MTRRTASRSSVSGPATRHRWLAGLRLRRVTCEQCGQSGQRSYCDVCGYDLARRTRADAPKLPNV